MILSFDVDEKLIEKSKMNDEKEDPILAAPKEESPAEATTSSTIPEEKLSDEKEQIRLNYDQRRFSLLNNPTYGVILAFLDKFRAHIDLQDYPLHLLEENLLNDQDNSKQNPSSSPSTFPHLFFS